jgi:hypothetical protein
LATLGADVVPVAPVEASMIRGEAHALLTAPAAGPVLFGIFQKCKPQALKKVCDAAQALPAPCTGTCSRGLCAPDVTVCTPCHPPEEKKILRCVSGKLFCKERTGTPPEGEEGGPEDCGGKTEGTCLHEPLQPCKKKNLLRCTTDCIDLGIDLKTPCDKVASNCTTK